ncbi:MAG: acyltransferase family protein [Lachnospiraceae bacterium]|nr:acyltransferase family protein [Lachnospiraceae bacterium]
METLQSNKTARIEWIDAAKGLLMLLVIWGHSTSSVEVHNYISSFYMSAFFILSGYTMREKLVLPLWKHIANRAISLLGPYLLFSGLWIAYSCLKSMIVPTNFSVTSAFLSVFLPYSGRTNGSVYDFWFLPCMFLAHAIFCMTIYPYKQYKASGIILWLICLLVGMSIERSSLLLCTSAAVMFVGVGYAAKKGRGGVQHTKSLV